MGAAAMMGVSGVPLAAKTPEAGVSFPDLPYSPKSLEPYISSRTIDFHHGKHHQAYVTNTIKLISGTDLEKLPLVEMIQKTYGKPDMAGIYNNAAQSFNHDFYWKSMKPGGGGKPSSEQMSKAIEKSFGDYTGFVQAFTDAAMTQFGSGWAWLVKKGGKLAIVKTANADSPLTMGMIPLLTIDVWEHAYYLDYQNRRGDYIKFFIDHLVNWNFAETNYQT
jgi:Fe-Mn family superoxide dismutase